MTQTNYTGPSGSNGSPGGVSAFIASSGPTVTASNINLSGHTGTNNAFKIGDTVTATWNDTGTGDGKTNTDSGISSVTVDFSQFGGGTAVPATDSNGIWTAAYTITSGSINGVTGRNVSVSATNSSGSTTTAGTSNVTVDDVAPSAPTLALTSDTGTSSTDKITSDPAIIYTKANSADTLLYSTTGASNSYSTTIPTISGDGSHTVYAEEEDPAGNIGPAASLTFTLDTTPPVLSSATVNGNHLTLTYIENGSGLAINKQPLAVDLTVLDGGTEDSVTSITVNANDTITLGLATAVAYGDNVTISYRPSDPTGVIQDNAGNAAAFLSGQTVTNTTPAPAPTIAVTGTTTEAVLGGAAINAATGVTITDLGHTTLSSATVSLGSGSPLTEVLAFTNDGMTEGDITETSYSNGVLTLTSKSGATLAQWQNALDAVTYQAAGTIMATGQHLQRQVSWSVSDVANSSTPATTVLTIDRRPVANPDTAHTAIVGGGAVTGNVIADSLKTDADGDPLTITSIQSGGVVYSVAAGSTATNSGTQILSLYGTLTIGADGSYSYAATGGTGHPIDTFTYTESDGHGGTASSTLMVSLDQPPTVTLGTNGVTAVPTGSGGSPVTLQPTGVTLSDPDLDAIASATVAVSSGLSAGDALSIDSSALTSFNDGETFSATGNGTSSLTLSASGTANATQIAADFQTLLGKVTFSTTSTSTTTRTISFTATDSFGAASHAQTEGVGIDTGPTIAGDALVAGPSGSDVNVGTFTFQVRFDSAVTVDTTHGTPTLNLNTGTTNTAVFAGVSQDGKTLTFIYIVGPGDNAADLKATALNLNGGTIKDANGANAVLTSFATIDTGVQIDTTPPTIAISTINGGNPISLADAQAGVTISGTSDAEDKQNVTVNLYAGNTTSGTPVDTLSASVSGGKWSTSLTRAEATALKDGTYTVTADVSDRAGNAAREALSPITVAASPTITGATYDAATGTLTVTGTNFDTSGGATINPNDLKLTGQGGVSLVLGTLSLNNVTPTLNQDGTTSFTVNLSSGLAAVDAILDKSGTTARDGQSTFTVSAAAGYDTTATAATASGTIAVSSSGAPTISDSNFTAPSIPTTTATPIFLDNASTGYSATVSDKPDFTGVYTGGTLAITLINATANDTLGIGTTSDITSTGTTAGSTISYDGKVIGTIDSAATGASGHLQIDLGAGATDAAIEALIGATTLSESGSTNTGAQSVGFTLTDAYGRSGSPLGEAVNFVTPALTIGRVDPAVSDQSTDTDQSTASPFSNVMLTDNVPGDTVTVKVSFDNTEGGAFSGYNPASSSVTTSGSTTTWTETGTASAVRNDLQALTFVPAPSKVAPGQTVKTAFTIDASGTAAGSATTDKGISVLTTDLNVAPTLTGVTASNPTFTVGATTPATLFTGGVAANTAKVSGFDSLTLRVTGLQDGANEALTIDGTSVALTDQTTATTATNSYGVAVSVKAGTAIVTIDTNPSNTPAIAQQIDTLIDGLGYADTAAAPTAGTRTVTLTSLQNSGGTADGGVDTTALAIASNVGLALAAPSAPVLAAASDTGSSSSDGLTGLNTGLVFSGTGVAGTTVTLYDGKTAIGNNVVDQTGKWSVTTTGTLTDGPHSIIAQASETGGITSPVSTATPVTIDTIPPAIAITAPIAVNNTVNAATAAAGFSIAGTTTGAEDGQPVTVKLVDARNGVADTYTTTETAGAWRVAVPAADAQSLADGTYTVEADVSDKAGNPAVEATQTIKIDETPATFTALSEVPATGAIGVGAAVTLTLTTSKAVTVTGTPTLTLNDGGTATYDAAKSTATSLVFDDVVASTDTNVATLAPTQVNLPKAATIADLSGNPANLSLARLIQAGGIGGGGLQIDTVPPALTGVSETPAGGTLTPGQSDVLTLTTSKAVIVSGTPTLSLNDGGIATYDAAKSTTTALAFDYTVGAGDQPVAALSATALNLAGGTIKDAAGNALTGSPGTFAQTGPQIVPTPAFPPSALPSTAALFGSITHDVTSPAGDIYALYQTILGRAPDAVGLEQDIDALARGTSLSQIAGQLLSSAEYTHDHGPFDRSTRADFLTQLYQDGLHRATDPDGLQGWARALNHGASRAEVAVDIALSDESRAGLAGVFQTGVFVPDPTASAISRLYYTLLHRAPDAGGLAGFESEAAQGVSLRTISKDLIGSPEYAGLHGAQNDAQFVHALFEGAFGQSTGHNAGAYVHELHNGTTRAAVAVQIAQSPDAVAHLSPNIETGFKLA